MLERKPDLTNPKNLMNWVLYGLATVAGWAYFDMEGKNKIPNNLSNGTYSLKSIYGNLKWIKD